MSNDSVYRISSKGQANLYNNNGEKISHIELGKGDFLELYGLVSVDPPETADGFGAASCIDYYIKTLRQ